MSGGAGDDVFQLSGTVGGYDAIDGGIGTDTIQVTAANTVIGLFSDYGCRDDHVRRLCRGEYFGQ